MNLARVPFAFSLVLAVAGGEASAQTRVQQAQPRPFNFFNLFFQQPQHVAPEVVRPQRPTVERPSEPTRPPKAGVEVAKPAATVRLAVIGDTWGEWVSYGLTQILAENAEIAILDRTRSFAGVVRSDNSEFIKLVGDVLAKDTTVDGLIVLVGGADRFMPLKRDGVTFEPGSDGWRTAFAERIDHIATALKARGVPLIWVGLPPVRGQKAMVDYGVMNDIIKTQAEKHQIAFVDIWNGFLDEKGAYAPSGPDVNGQIKRLRHGDGFHFTPTGGRKLGFFVEQEVKRTFVARMTTPGAAMPPPPFMDFMPDGSTQTPEVAPKREKPAIGPSVVITGAGGTAVTPPGHVTLDGGPKPKPRGEPALAPPAKGHAMDFRWKPAQSQP